MKRIISLILIVASVCAILCGCDFWANGEYLTVMPHEEEYLQMNNEIIHVSSFTQIQDVLKELVENGAENAVVSADAFNIGTLNYLVESAIDHLVNKNPVGAYAVDKIDYEIGTNRGTHVVAFDFSYLHNRSEILRIKKVKYMSDAEEQIYNALNNCDHSLVIRVERYVETDFVQLVQNYTNDNPDLVMELPKVSANVYPQSGEDRIIEINFTYQTGRDQLIKMQDLVSPFFQSAELYVRETKQVSEIYYQLYSFLMERNRYKIEASITPTYSLLQHGVGDSRAFANVYAKMCRMAGLECRVVTGTRDGASWCWNIVRYRGKYYHIDLLHCSEQNTFTMTLSYDMVNYVWDYSMYPFE